MYMHMYVYIYMYNCICIYICTYVYVFIYVFGHILYWQSCSPSYAYNPTCGSLELAPNLESLITHHKTYTIYQTRAHISKPHQKKDARVGAPTSNT